MWLRPLCQYLYYIGSAPEFVGTRILGCFLKNDEFGLCDRHALSLERQVAEILVAAAPSKKSLDVAVDGFHHTETYFGAAVVQDPVQGIQQHLGQFLKGRQPLPSQFIDPALQVAKHRSFLAVGPQPRACGRLCGKIPPCALHRWLCWRAAERGICRTPSGNSAPIGQCCW